MTSRTHDLAAAVALTGATIYFPQKDITLATALVAFGANFLGGLAPDIDEPTAKFWKNIRGGSVLGKVVAPILGSHRLISHSALGFILAGFLLSLLQNAISGILIVDHNIVWWAFMIGFASHLVTDALTKEGIPLLFPLPFRFGIPPLKALRIPTGGIVEKGIIFPGLMLIEGYLIYKYYPLLLEIIR